MPRPARRGPTTLEAAFRALGPAPTHRELRLVRKPLAAAGADPRGEPFEALVAIAEQNGASGFVALDLVSEPETVPDEEEVDVND
jgi:hypothetical protein